MILKNKAINIILSIGILVLLFQNVISIFWDKIDYFDDLLSIICIIYLVYSYLFYRKINKNELMLIITMLILILLTLSFNYVFKIQSNYLAILIDIISNFKFLFVFLGVSRYLKNQGTDIYLNLNFIYFLAKIYLIILSFFGTVNLFRDIGMFQEYRYGLRTFSFIFGTPGQVINISLGILFIILLENILKNKNNYIYILLSIYVMGLTLKSRAFVLIGMFLCFYLLFIFKKNIKINKYLVVIFLLGIVIGFPQFKYYFMGSPTPRQRFLMAGWDLFKSNFPWGTGFATFGSSAAAVYYSPLYVIYGFIYCYGMKPNEQYFLNDTFWPMIMAQFGFFGSILYIFILYIFIRMLFKLGFQSNNMYVKISILFFIGNFLFSSIQSSYPNTSSMVLTTILISLICWKGNSELT